MLYGILIGVLAMSLISIDCYFFRKYEWSKWFCGPVMWVFWLGVWIADQCSAGWRESRKRKYLRNSRALIRDRKTRQIYYTTRDRAFNVVHGSRFEAVSMSDLGIDNALFPDYIDLDDQPYYCPKEIYSLYPAY